MKKTLCVGYTHVETGADESRVVSDGTMLNQWSGLLSWYDISLGPLAPGWCPAAATDDDDNEDVSARRW